MSTGLRVVLVDDEEPARRLLGEYLGRMEDLEVVAECANGYEAVKAVSEHRPDLLLLDIQMPKLDGFEVLDLLDREVAVVFITAYDEFALRAFEVHAVDYLLKPVSPERLSEAIARVRERAPGRRDAAGETALRGEARRRRAPLERILVREGTQVHVIPVESIIYLEAQDDYVAIVGGGKRLLKQQTLSELESLLDPAKFVRIHRSFLVNASHLAKLELYAKDSHLAVLGDGTHLPVSRAGYARLRKLL